MSLFKEVAFPGKYRDDNAIHDLVNYITQPNKTHNEIVDGMQVADYQKPFIKTPVFVCAILSFLFSAMK